MIPNLTTEQRRANLEKAKAARQRRAAILKGAEIKQPVYVVLVPEVAAYASAASFPVDSAGKLVFLNDTVEHEGSEYQVVAMSHRNKVVIRPKGQTYGGKWVKAGSVRVTRHVLGVR